MRFLCLHGIGSNSRILQQQTAAIRYELGNQHSYDFVEGTLPWDPDPVLKDSIIGDEKTFSYCDPNSPLSCLQVVHDLERYVATEGPYDGIIGFSLGAVIAMSCMLNDQKRKDGPAKLPFKVGIFFCNTFPLYDIGALSQGRMAHLDSVPESLDLPTAHIWGAADAGQELGEIAFQACKAEKRSLFVHGKGHEIPTSADDVISMVKVINRALGMVERSV